MTDKITDPVTPEVLDPLPPAVLAGDWTDDDSEVYQDDFEHADSGPQKHTGIPHPVAKVKPTTRIIAVSHEVGTPAATLVEPVMLLPADPNRSKLLVQVMGTNGTEFTISDSKSGCYNGINFYSATAGAILDLSGHTGALWAYSTSSGSGVKVSAVAVTV